MSAYALAAFLILFGIMGLASTSIPHWVLALLALIAGVLVLVEGGIRSGLWKKGP